MTMTKKKTHTADILYISQNATYPQIHTRLSAKNIHLTNTTGHYRSLTLLTNCTYKRENNKGPYLKSKKLGTLSLKYKGEKKWQA